MPLFEYHCTTCDQTFEKLLDQPVGTTPCPKCGQDSKRVVSVFAASGYSSCAVPSGSGFR